MEQVGDKPEEVRRHLEEEQRQLEGQQPSGSGVRPDDEAEQTPADDEADVSGRDA
ncbi:hypothetical protein ACFYZE_09595 [Streptomyces sp. NPDC001796]|uniref:hypothetical protein n=1 Tax=Streptomyces sp. NPDC001796 TaxID=3364609 RepID=UPI00367A38CF